jgi:hypothetical protein
MSEITKEVSIRRFCSSLARRIHLWRSRGTQEQDEIALSSASLETGPPKPPVNRITKQGRLTGVLSPRLRTAQSRSKEQA